MSDDQLATARLTNLLRAAAMAVHDTLAEAAAQHGYSVEEHAALILVHTLDGPSQDDLQRRLGLSQPGSSRLLDRLSTRGLLIRAAGPDRRTNALQLTSAGHRVARQALALRQRVLKPLTDRLDATGQAAVTAQSGSNTHRGRGNRPVTVEDLPAVRPARLRHRRGLSR
jgi:DNA-binding MarR family transcriptional regulator